eukprot:gene16265-19300_t
MAPEEQEEEGKEEGPVESAGNRWSSLSARPPEPAVQLPTNLPPLAPPVAGPISAGNAGGRRATHHHLYKLTRGLTGASIDGLAFSSNSRWLAVSSARGTTHVYAIQPQGGEVGCDTHVAATAAADGRPSPGDPGDLAPSPPQLQLVMELPPPPPTVHVRASLGRIHATDTTWRASMGSAAAAAGLAAAAQPVAAAAAFRSPAHPMQRDGGSVSGAGVKASGESAAQPAEDDLPFPASSAPITELADVGRAVGDDAKQMLDVMVAGSCQTLFALTPFVEMIPIDAESRPKEVLRLAVDTQSRWDVIRGVHSPERVEPLALPQAQGGEAGPPSGARMPRSSSSISVDSGSTSSGRTSGEEGPGAREVSWERAHPEGALPLAMRADEDMIEGAQLLGQEQQKFQFMAMHPAPATGWGEEDAAAGHPAFTEAPLGFRSFTAAPAPQDEVLMHPDASAPQQTDRDEGVSQALLREPVCALHEASPPAATTEPTAAPPAGHHLDGAQLFSHGRVQDLFTSGGAMFSALTENEPMELPFASQRTPGGHFDES